MVLGVLLLGETVTYQLVIGMVLVLAGIFIGSGLYADWKKSGTRASSQAK